MESPYGFKGDGKDLPKGATAKSLEDMLGPLADNLSKILKLLKKVWAKLRQQLRLVLRWLRQKIWKRKSTTN